MPSISRITPVRLVAYKKGGNSLIKIITVCGLGVGSSLILKMTCESAMKQLGLSCDIEHWDMGTVRSRQFDILVTTEEFRKNFEDLDNVVYVRNMVDVNAAKANLEEYLKSKETI